MGPGDQRGRLAITNRRVQRGSRWKSHADGDGQPKCYAYIYADSYIYALSYSLSG